MQLSFSVIFSVIIIIATLAVAGYIIVQFINRTKDVECKLFYDDLQKKIDTAWQADDSVSSIFTESVAAKTEKVCFGNVSQNVQDEKDQAAYDALKNFASTTDNLFFYPRTVCGGSKFRFNLKHAKTDTFFCVSVINKQASVKVAKGSFDSLVKLCTKDKPCPISDVAPTS